MALLKRISFHLMNNFVKSPRIQKIQQFNEFLIGDLKKMNNRFFSSASNRNIFSIENGEDFDEKVVHSDVPVLVDFHADWCGPCKTLGPRLEAKIEGRDGKIILGKINVDSAGDLANEFQIEAIPTLIAFKNGEISHRFEGVIDDEEIDQLLDEMEYENEE